MGQLGLMLPRQDSVLPPMPQMRDSMVFLSEMQPIYIYVRAIQHRPCGKLQMVDYPGFWSTAILAQMRAPSDCGPTLQTKSLFPLSLLAHISLQMVELVL